MICSAHCKHYGRCDHETGDDCYEPRPVTPFEAPAVTLLCARALTEENSDLRKLALTLHRSKNVALANRLALHAMELKDSGIVS